MQRTSIVHYIDPSCISITPNANTSVNDLAIYVARGTKIKVYSPRAGIDMKDNTFKEWAITGRNRHLGDETKPYTIYARLSREDTNNGYLVFAAKTLHEGKWVDKYSSVTPEGQSVLYKDNGFDVRVTDPDFWYVRLGDVSLPNENKREVTFDTGILGTDDFNTNWALNSDALPLRIELSGTIDDEDAGPTPYVRWGQSLVLSASLIEGWTGTDINRFDHWEITRNTGDADSDNKWPSDNRKAIFSSLGIITLSHEKGSDDDFNGAISSSFVITAFERIENPDNPDAPVFKPLVSSSINIQAEAEEIYEISWTDPRGIIDNIPCDASGKAKYKTGSGSDQWLAATLYKRAGGSAPVEVSAAKITLHAYDVNGNEVQNFPRTKTGDSSISLDNYDAAAAGQSRYLVVFADSQDDIIASSSISRVLDGEAGNDGVSVLSYTLLPSSTSINVGRSSNNEYSPAFFTLRCGYRREYQGNVKVVHDVTIRIDETYNLYYRKKLRTSDAWQPTYYKYTYYKDSESQGYTLINVSVALFSEVEFILCTNTDNEVSANDVTGLYTIVNVPVVVQGMNGVPGERGKIGRFFYYAGVFDAIDEIQSFVINDVQAPYFLTNKTQNTFHVFNYDTNGAYTMAQMYAIEPDFNNLPWEIMTNDFKYVITSAIFASNAKLGSFVVSGDWLISQHGTVNGAQSTEYILFDAAYPNVDHTYQDQSHNFIPNFAVDGLTGKTYQHDGYFEGTIKSANAEISGKVTANEGKIGKFSISNDGLYDGTYDPNTWFDNPENFVFVNTSVLRIGQKDSYDGHTYAWTSVFMGQQSDPEEQDSNNYCDSAMYVYRRMVEGHNPYKPAVKIISHNAGNIDVAIRLQGAVQVHGGGVIEQGRYLAYTGSGDVNTLNLTKGTTFVINNQTTGVAYFYLPTLIEVRTQLGIASGTPFAIPITITAHRSSFDFVIRTTAGQNEFIYSNDGGKVNVQENSWSSLDMWKGDAVRLILIYDGTTYYIQMAGHFT